MCGVFLGFFECVGQGTLGRKSRGVMPYRKQQKRRVYSLAEEKMIDNLLANGWERGWISDANLQAIMRAEKEKQRNKHLLPGDYH